MTLSYFPCICLEAKSRYIENGQYAGTRLGRDLFGTAQSLTEFDLVLTIMAVYEEQMGRMVCGEVEMGSVWMEAGEGQNSNSSAPLIEWDIWFVLPRKRCVLKLQMS